MSNLDHRMSTPRIWPFRFAFVLWIGVIFWFSSQPDLKSALETWQDVLLRKIAHLAEYFVLAYFYLRSLRHTQPASPAATIGTLAVALAVAASDELYQTTVHGRSGKPTDVLIDVLGGAAMLCLRWVVSKRKTAYTGTSPR